MGCLLTFDISQGFTTKEIQELAIIYWTHRELNFHIFIAEA